MIEEDLKNLKKANEIYPEYEYEHNQPDKEPEQATDIIFIKKEYYMELIFTLTYGYYTVIYSRI